MNRAVCLAAVYLASVLPVAAQSTGFFVLTTTVPDATLNTSYSTQLVAAGGVTPFSWYTNEVSGLPPGLSLSSSGAINGTPTAAGTYDFTVFVYDYGQRTASRSLRIVVRNPASTFSISNNSPLPEGAVGQTYFQQLVTTAGSPPISFAVAGGSLPPGLSLIASGGIGGTPTLPGDFTFTVRAGDVEGQFTSKVFLLRVVAPVSILAITTASLPTAIVGTPYSLALTATGGVPAYSWAGGLTTLPPGLSISPSGVISGTPTVAGDYRVSVVVTDAASSPARASATLSLRVVTTPLTIATASPLPAGRVGDPYSTSISAAGGAPGYTFSAAAAGSLPPGISLLQNGALSGTPTQAGNFQFTVLVADTAQLTASRLFSLTVTARAPSIVTETLRAAISGASYTETLNATGGTPPYNWSLSSGSLPAGIALNTTTGVLSGTPTAAGSFPLGVTVTDSASQTATRQYTLVVASPLTITTASPLPALTPGTPAQITFAATGGTTPYNWSISSGALPAGLTLNASTGVASGTPTGAGPFTLEATVTDANGQTARRQFTGTVGALRITTTSLAPATVGVAYRATLQQQGGTAPLTWSVSSGSLPAGLTLSASSGEIAGTPTAAGNQTFTVAVSDNARLSASQALQLTVGLPVVSGVTINAPDSVQSNQQPNITVALASALPVAADGSIVLTFAPDTNANSDDPAIQFSTGGRTLNFNIPAGATQGVFSVPNVALQSGTVAGTITLTTNLRSGGSPLQCNCTLTRQIRIPRSAPVLQSVRVNRVQNGFNILITGFSSTRDLTAATFRFTGTNLNAAEFTVPVTSPFSVWYQSSQSAEFGSQFLLTQPFTLQGDSNAVSSVTVTLTNSAGTSPAQSANF